MPPTPARCCGAPVWGARHYPFVLPTAPGARNRARGRQLYGGAVQRIAQGPQRQPHAWGCLALEAQQRLDHGPYAPVARQVMLAAATGRPERVLFAELAARKLWPTEMQYEYTHCATYTKASHAPCRACLACLARLDKVHGMHTRPAEQAEMVHPAVGSGEQSGSRHH